MPADNQLRDSYRTKLSCTPGLKLIVILVLEYSLGFKINYSNILFNRRSGKMAILL